MNYQHVTVDMIIKTYSYIIGTKEIRAMSYIHLDHVQQKVIYFCRVENVDVR